MVNPDSDLYRAHPDWVIEFSRAAAFGRAQSAGAQSRAPDVRDYVLKAVDDLLSQQRHPVPEMGLQPQLVRARLAATGSAGPARNLCDLYPQPLWNSRRAAQAPSQAGDRGLFGRRRPRRSGDHGSDRPGLGFGQHRSLRPTEHPGRLHPRLCARRDDGLGDGFAQLGEQSQHVARLSLSVGDAGLAGHRRRSQQMDGRRFRRVPRGWWPPTRRCARPCSRAISTA